MKWFLGTYIGRFNRRHKLFGHLFSGRYKSLLVDGSGNGYLKTVCDYVHGSEEIDAKPTLTCAGRADDLQGDRLAGLKQRLGDLDFPNAVAVFVVVLRHRVGDSNSSIRALP